MNYKKLLKLSIFVALASNGITLPKEGSNLELSNGDSVINNYAQSSILSVDKDSMITIKENADVRFLENSLTESGIGIFALNGSTLNFGENLKSPENRLSFLDITNATIKGVNEDTKIYVGKLDAKEGLRIEFGEIHINQNSTLSGIGNSAVNIKGECVDDKCTSLTIEGDTHISGAITNVNLELGTEEVASTASGVVGSNITNIRGSSTIVAKGSTFENGSINTIGVIQTSKNPETLKSSIYKVGATNKTTKAIIEDNGSTFNGEIFANELSLTNSDLINVSSIEVEKLTAKDIKNKNALLTDKTTTPDVKPTNKITTTNAIFDATDKMIMNFHVDTQTLQAINTTFTGKINSKDITSSNSTFARRFSTDNLIADNSNFILGGSEDTYAGAIISKNSTSGANNTISLLGIVSGGKLQKDKIANLPLAVLKKGTADINTFITKYQALDGIDLYDLNPKYMAKNEINGYLVYALDKSGTNTDMSAINFRDNDKIDNFNIADIANNTRGGIGSFVNYINGVDKEINATFIEKLASANIIDKNTEAPESEPNVGGSSSESTESGSTNNPNGNTNPDSSGSNNSNGSDNNTDLGNGSSNNGNDNSNNSSNGSNENTNPTTPNIPNLNNQEAQAVKITDDLIQQVSINKKAVAEVKSLGTSISFAHAFEWNNLNKRMGDIRNQNGEFGIWSRFELTKASLNDYKLSFNEIQVGADKKLSLNNGDLFVGFMVNGSNGSDENNNVKSTNLGLGLYSAMLFNNGYFIDTVLRISNYDTKFDHDMFLDGLKNNNTGFLGSFEFGKRFDSDIFYVEPSASIIISYEPGINLSSKVASIVSSDTVRLHTKASVFSGFKLNDNINLRLGLGYAADLNNSSDIKLKSLISKKEETIKGSKYHRGFANIGTNVFLGENTRINLEYEKSFGGDLSIDHQLNATLRYSF